MQYFQTNSVFRPQLPRNMTAMCDQISYSACLGATSRAYNTKNKYQICRYADLRGPLRNSLAMNMFNYFCECLAF